VYPGAIGIQLDVPTVRLTHAEGTALVDLLGEGPVTVTATGQLASPYRYNVRLNEEGQISEDQHTSLDTAELAAVTNSFHSQLGGELTLTESWYARQPFEDYAVTFPTPTLGGSRERVDYYIAEPGLRYNQNVDTPERRYNWLFPADEVAQIFIGSTPRKFEPGEQVQQSWLGAPVRPALWRDRSVV